MPHAAADRALELLNEWQHSFPLVRAPFSAIGHSVGLGEREVIETYRRALAEGALSRIGGVFDSRAGGAGVLAALAVPPERLDEVARLVSAHPGVNHNYEREHRVNLWFVMTGFDAAAVARDLDQLAERVGLPLLRLPMRAVYRIDLGFDLRGQRAECHAARLGASPPPPPLTAAERPLAAQVEAGLPLQPLPFDAWALALDSSPQEVLMTLRRWLSCGVLRRFGTVVRHHELGFAANAMTVFEVPDERVDTLGAALAREPGLSLVYRRERAAGWPYNLYAMVHGRDRAGVTDVLAGVIARHQLHGVERQVLFSRRRFKQTGARRFRVEPRAPLPEPEHAGAR
jgi:DNA-binding Lrp family transcriptional regulator